MDPQTPVAKSPLITLMCLVMAVPAFGSGPSFNRDIRPILSENCFLCHGQDPEHRGGELRLDVREDAIA